MTTPTSLLEIVKAMVITITGENRCQDRKNIGAGNDAVSVDGRGAPQVRNAYDGLRSIISPKANLRSPTNVADLCGIFC